VHTEEINGVATVTKASRMRWAMRITYAVKNIKTN
jgi:hypothetical protein